MKALYSAIVSLPLLLGACATLPTETQYVQKAEEVNALKRRERRLQASVAELESRVGTLANNIESRNASSGGASSDSWASLSNERDTFILQQVLKEKREREEAVQDVKNDTYNAMCFIQDYEDLRETAQNIHRFADEKIDALQERNLHEYVTTIQSASIAELTTTTLTFKRETVHLAEQREKIHEEIDRTIRELLTKRLQAEEEFEIAKYDTDAETTFRELRERIENASIGEVPKETSETLPENASATDLEVYHEGEREASNIAARLNLDAKLEKEIAALKEEIQQESNNAIGRITILRERVEELERKGKTEAELTGSLNGKRAYIFALQVEKGQLNLGDLNKPIGYLTQQELTYAIEQGYLQQNALSLLERGATGIKALSMDKPEDLQRALGYHVVVEPGSLELLTRNGKVYATDGSKKSEEEIRKEIGQGVTFYIGVRENMPKLAQAVAQDQQETILDKMSQRDRRAYGAIQLGIKQAKDAGTADDDSYLKALREQERALLRKYE